RTRRYVERVQPLHISGDGIDNLFCDRDDIEGLRRRIDHRRTRNANFRIESTSTDVLARYCRDPGGRIDKADFPQRRRVRTDIAVSVEGIQAVMLGSYEHNIVRALGGD